MGMPAHAKRWTVDEVRALQDESRAWPRYELIDGALLVTNAPSPRHQRAAAILLAALEEYCKSRRIGIVFMSPADLELEPGTIAQPDVFVVPSSDGRVPAKWNEVRTLLLAVEILSPSNARQDRVDKRRYYSRARVPEYWIVDLDARVVERWRPGDLRGELLEETLSWIPDGAATNDTFVLDLADFFARTTGS